MVGDLKQRIFAFAGAIENSFEKAKIDFNAQHLDLTEVYRSTDEIVKAYSNLFENHSVIENKSVNNNLDIKVSIIQTKKDNHQAYVENIVKQLIEKCDIDLPEIAILSTSWYTAFPVSKALRQNYSIVGLGALPHKSISNSTVSLLRILAKHFVSSKIRTLRGIKRNIEMHLFENGLQFTEKELNRRTNKLITQFISIQSDENIVNGIDNLKNIFDSTFNISHSTFNEIIDLITDQEKQSWDIGHYLKTLAGVDGIICNTIHKVKGLEFDAVILNEMNENKIPYQKLISRSSWTYEELTSVDIENGRNLFYVAVSRARKYLIILHNWKPSMFIEMIKN
jgi:superfamily I DNA/RNA helicase